MLTEWDHVPAGLLECAVRELHTVLPGPTLIHLPGRDPRPLFVSVLLHGNEHTGFRAMQTLLKRFLDRELPRALSLFIGNVEAATLGVRRLDHQPDFNRVWPGCEHEPCAERDMMADIVDIMRERDVFASIDIHNNTGLNPHYACVNKLENNFFHLATLFSRTVVYFIRPCGVQSMAFAELCPSVTIECGKSANMAADQLALEFVEAALHLQHFPEHPIHPQDISLFHTTATVKVKPGYTFGFGCDNVDISWINNLDRFNFQELPTDTLFADCAVEGAWPIEAISEDGHDVTDRVFTLESNQIRTAMPLMPAMLTIDSRVIQQDCLCYIMERISLPPAKFP